MPRRSGQSRRQRTHRRQVPLCRGRRQETAAREAHRGPQVTGEAGDLLGGRAVARRDLGHRCDQLAPGRVELESCDGVGRPCRQDGRVLGAGARPGEPVERQDAQGVDVDRRAARRAVERLRREVALRRQVQVGYRYAGAQLLGSEVEQTRTPRGVDDHVRRPNLPVHEPRGVNRGQRVRQVADHLGDAPCRQHRHSPERFAGHVLGGEPAAPRVAADAEHRSQVRMPDRDQRLGSLRQRHGPWRRAEHADHRRHVAAQILCPEDRR